ncbi:MAG: adaptor protein MecA [Lachnospiraceae bacterium]|nr:adaptor protein MecA [Lachnospiraceae bacterium]
MHIEKINDNQIKCILSQRDLLARELDLSELAYGTEKARSLFHEMIEQAHEAFGFEAENTPLMVEAIPVSRESIVLIITRIDNPDELDTRFSRFSSMDNDDLTEDYDDSPNGADEILDLFRSADSPKEDSAADAYETPDGDSDEDLLRINHEIQSILEGRPHDLLLQTGAGAAAQDLSTDTADTADTTDTTDSDSAKASASAEHTKQRVLGSKEPVNLIRIYSFDKLDTLIELSGILHPLYNGVNSLYKDTASGIYYLVVYQSHHTPSEFNKTCNILSEYGKREGGTSAREAYYMEHFNCIVSQTALQRLYLF